MVAIHYIYNNLIDRMNKILNNKYEKKRFLRTYLANHGWQEIITYSLVSSEMRKDFLFSSTEEYHLLMPKSRYHEYYRQTLVPSHLKTLKYNFSHGNKDLFFFEISSVYGLSYEEELLVLSGTGNFFNQPLHKLVQKMDFY